MWKARSCRWRAVAVTLAVAISPVAPTHVVGTAQESRGALEVLNLQDLAGEWFEIAATTSWSKRRCVSNTRYVFSRRSSTALDARRECTTSEGAERKRGRLVAAANGSGALKLRLTPAIFAPLPAAWEDFWVLAQSADRTWMLVGDRRRDSGAVLSRTVVLDEAALATALAEARVLGYDVGRLVAVPQPAGAWGLLPSSDGAW